MNPDKGWEIDLDNLKAQIKPETKAILVNNPSNPCGSCFTKEHMEEILKVAEGDASKQEENSMVHEKVPEPEPEYDSPILYEKTVRVGISNKSHTKVLNSIQIIYVFEIVTAMA